MRRVDRADPVTVPVPGPNRDPRDPATRPGLAPALDPVAALTDLTGMRHRPVLIGLSGPIGCGKSTVAGWLEERGGRRIDLDELAREATAPGAPTLAAIRDRFGAGVFAADGSLDRGALARVVFADPAALRDLEAIVHPSVRHFLVREIAAASAAGTAFVVIEAIKLVESGIGAACDAVWIVDCGPAMQRARLAGRGVQPEDAERRIAAQGPDLADRLLALLASQAPSVPARRLVTDGSEAAVRAEVDAALLEVLSRSR